MDEDYYHTVQWMQEALVQMEREGEDVIANMEDVLEYLSFSLFKQGNLKHALKYTEDLYKMSEYSIFIGGHGAHFQIPTTLEPREMSNGMKTYWKRRG